MKCIEIINNCDLNKIDFLVDRIDESIELIHMLAQEKDMRSYIFLVSMINYCKHNNENLISELSNFAAFISLNFFNYIEGMIKLSYFHQIEAIKNDPQNNEYKKTFIDFFYTHPDVDHDVEFEMKILSELECK